MTAFDTDVLVEILSGNPTMVEHAATVPIKEQSVPIVVVEEILRARLNAVRQAEAGRGRLDLSRAYELFQRSVVELRRLTVLPYTAEAHALFQQWRAEKVRVATHDLRIAAICVDRHARLASRNRRDFDKVPGLDVEYWD